MIMPLFYVWKSLGTSLPFSRTHGRNVLFFLKRLTDPTGLGTVTGTTTFSLACIQALSTDSIYYAFYYRRTDEHHDIGSSATLYF